MSPTAADTPQLAAAEVQKRIADATAAAFRAESEEHRRDPHHVGLSAIGGCPRQVAYALARVPPSDVPAIGENRAANLGTWEHEGLLPRLAAQLPGARIEVPVTLRVAGLVLEGHIDLDHPETGPVDLKTVGEHRLGGVRRTSAAYKPHRMQVDAYALAKLQAGQPPSFVSWLYMDRANGDREILTEPFTTADALRVVDHVRWLREFADTDPDMAPISERGPRLSLVCDECWFLKRCWGPDAEPGVIGAQSAKTDPEVEAALRAYDEARARETAARNDKKFAEAQLSHVRYDIYGAYEYGRGKPGEQLDQRAAAARLRELGEPVPMAPKRGAIKVKLVKRLDPPMDIDGAAGEED